MSKKLSAIIICAMFALCASDAFAEEKKHTVNRGDTLWDLSAEYYGDNWKWPVIWKYNVKINDPDLIYPKEEFVIPFLNSEGELIDFKKDSAQTFRLGEKKKEQQNDTASADKSLHTDIEPPRAARALNFKHVNNFEIVLSEPVKIEVKSTEGGKFFVSKNDIFVADAGSSQGFKKGRTVAVVTRDSDLANGDIIYRIVGYGTILKTFENTSRIVLDKTYEAITKGYKLTLMDRYEIIEPNGYKKVTTDINGEISYLVDERRLIGEGGRFIVNIGRMSGLKPGDILSVVRTFDEDGFKKTEQIGEGQVIHVSDNYATAVLIKTDMEVRQSDRVFLYKVAIY